MKLPTPFDASFAPCTGYQHPFGPDGYDGYMARVFIVGIVIGVAFTLYSLVDAAMTDHVRARGVPKPVWIVIIVALPVVGGLLWIFIGKGAVPSTAPAPRAPDDDPRFSGRHMSGAELDSHMRDLEARLKELDEEVFPGEDQGKDKEL